MNAADPAVIRRFWGNGFPITNWDYSPNATDDNRTEYIGVAPRGTANSSPGWLIEKITYVGGYPSTSRMSDRDVIWDNRTTTEYR